MFLCRKCEKPDSLPPSALAKTSENTAVCDRSVLNSNEPFLIILIKSTTRCTLVSSSRLCLRSNCVIARGLAFVVRFTRGAAPQGPSKSNRRTTYITARPIQKSRTQSTNNTRTKSRRLRHCTNNGHSLETDFTKLGCNRVFVYFTCSVGICHLPLFLHEVATASARSESTRNRAV
ncbi:hypothetical protein TcasGA2_TC008792 [Tribolium castaneum]|uniref:Uncharacterized protein n=1 Tax=Tribolium castaneum TaxID=7070 RepID=D6WRN3_TRICA|nr:hypothetical protein TcasGA2_TC008792 [Tribolium castaneum]